MAGRIQRIREVGQGPDGAIWLLQDGKAGRLLKLTPKGQ
ncbi:PQQ-dependent sugar dehydrogenase [Myxococcus xanthus]|nr:PQQ-dependent sugar dehydrogenase [Myxococcus xanthus]